MELTINDARNYLAAVMETDFKDRTFHGYIGATLAGDFAVEIATFMKSLEARLAAAEQENTRLSSLLYGGRCVYCGEVVGVDTLNQDLSDEVLKEHIKTCAAHPYVQMKERAEKAESALTAAQQSAKEQFGAVAVEFFYWWHNQPGTNTAQGFDEWWAIREAAKERGNE